MFDMKTKTQETFVTTHTPKKGENNSKMIILRRREKKKRFKHLDDLWLNKSFSCEITCHLDTLVLDKKCNLDMKLHAKII